MRQKQSGRTGLSWQGGVVGEIIDRNAENRALETITQQFNSKDKQQMLKEWSKGIAGHNLLEQDILEALKNGDKIEHDNKVHKQFINDLIMYQRLDRLDEFRGILNTELESTSDSNRENWSQVASEIREMMSPRDENGKVVSEPFPGLTDEQIVKQHREAIQGFKNKLDSYVKLSNNLRELVGDKFDKRGLDELVYLASIHEDVVNRLEKSNESVQSHLSNALNSPTLHLASEKSNVFSFKTEDGGKYTKTFNDLISMPVSELITSIYEMSNEDKALFKSLFEMVNPHGALNFNRHLAESMALQKLTGEFARTYNKYTKEPEALQKKIVEETQAILQEVFDRKVKNAVEKLQNVQT